MIPCKECIALAACRLKNDVDCKILYEWLRDIKHNKIITEFKQGNITNCFPGLMSFSRFPRDSADAYTVFFTYEEDKYI